MQFHVLTQLKYNFIVIWKQTLDINAINFTKLNLHLNTACFKLGIL